MRTLTAISLLALTQSAALAQSAGARPAFEVASVKPNTSGTRHSHTQTSASRLSMTNVTLQRCIENAYNIKSFLLSGPGWLDSERFDITAKVPAGSSEREFGAMLQTLLADRFKLAVHREPKTLSGYALLVGKGGPKLQEVAAGQKSSMNSENTKLTAQSASMVKLAEFLAGVLDGPVVDMTELAGAYDFNLEWVSDESTATAGGPAGPSLFTALQEQLGLRLRSQKVPVEILVVDHAEKVPKEN